MKKNFITASIIGLGLMIWLLTGLFKEPSAMLQDTTVTAQVRADGSAPTRVRVMTLNAEQRTLTQVLRGKTQSKQIAMVSAETSGRVVARPVERGQRVEAGAVLCELAMDSRDSAVRVAEAELTRARLEFEGAEKLKSRELLSEIRIAQLAADLETARRDLHTQQLNLQRRLIKAPFDGVVEKLHIDIGDLANVGSVCATLLNLDPLLVIADASERDIGGIELGKTVTARTSTDQRLDGVVTFVGRQSDAVTRTFPVEITVPNPDYRLRAGLTTVVSVEADTVLAHRVSPALFTLDDDGVLGLRTVNQRNRVEFYPITIVEDAEDGAWVTGLPGVVRLITVGHEYVSQGQLVETEEANDPTATASIL